MKKGFTLIEIMIVVAIIAILATLTIPNLLRARINTNEATTQSIMKTIIDSAVGYRAANPTYPANLEALSDDVPPYMSDTVCGDGLSNGYEFLLSGSSNAFTLTADPQIPGQTGQHYFFADQSGVITQGDASFASSGEESGGDEGDEGPPPVGSHPI